MNDSSVSEPIEGDDYASEEKLSLCRPFGDLPVDARNEAKAFDSDIPSSTATPAATTTPADDARGLAQQLAINDHTASSKDFSEFSQDEQDRIIAIYLDFLLQTAKVRKLDHKRTFRKWNEFIEAQKEKA